jgi:hypothetical protein
MEALGETTKTMSKWFVPEIFTYRIVFNSHGRAVG